MNPPQPQPLESLQRGARFSAIATLIGVVIVLASIAYGMWQIANTEDELRDKKNELEQVGERVQKFDAVLAKKDEEIKNKTGALTDLDSKVQGFSAKLKSKDDELHMKNTAIVELSKQEEDLTEKIKKANLDLAKAQKDVEEYQKQLPVVRAQLKLSQTAARDSMPKDAKIHEALWAKVDNRPAMISALVTPAASYIDLGKAPEDSPTGKWYRFQLDLKFPGDAKLADMIRKDIDSVTYELNHPYRPLKPLVVKAPSFTFAATFEGAGSLKNVVVHIALKNGPPVKLDFDMSKALPDVVKKK